MQYLLLVTSTSACQLVAMGILLSMNSRHDKKLCINLANKTKLLSHSKIAKTDVGKLFVHYKSRGILETD